MTVELVDVKVVKIKAVEPYFNVMSDISFGQHFGLGFYLRTDNYKWFHFRLVLLWLEVDIWFGENYREIKEASK